MTKSQKADLLLCAARHWQNEDSASRNVCCVDSMSDWVYLLEGLLTLPGIRGWCLWASAALSEVAALGFDIEDAP